MDTTSTRTLGLNKFTTQTELFVVEVISTFVCVEVLKSRKRGEGGWLEVEEVQCTHCHLSPTRAGRCSRVRRVRVPGLQVFCSSAASRQLLTSGSASHPLEGLVVW